MKPDTPLIEADTLAPGTGRGPLMRLDAPLSFWGGFDAHQGCVAEPAHPQYRAQLAGKVMLMARAKGSSSGSSVLAEAIRLGTAPAALVMRERDLIVALGSIVAAALYGRAMPVVVVDETAWQTLVALDAQAIVTVDAPDSAPARIAVAPGV